MIDRKEVARKCVTTIAIYQRLGGGECVTAHAVAMVCASAGLTEQERVDMLAAAREEPITPYWLGWVSRFILNDETAEAPPELARRLEGFLEDEPDGYKQGWRDSWVGMAAVSSAITHILSLLSTTNTSGRVN